LEEVARLVNQTTVPLCPVEQLTFGSPAQCAFYRTATPPAVQSLEATRNGRLSAIAVRRLPRVAVRQCGYQAFLPLGRFGGMVGRDWFGIFLFQSLGACWPIRNFGGEQ